MQPPLARALPPTAFAALCATLAGCMAHRFSPAPNGLIEPPPSIGSRLDLATDATYRGGRLPTVELGLATKPFADALPEAATQGAGAVARGERHPLRDLVVALESTAHLTEDGGDDLPIATLGLRTGWQSRAFAADLGLQFTAFTFVAGASLGPRFEVWAGPRVALRGQLDAYASAPLDPDMGYAWNRALFGATSGPRTRATAGGHARLGVGVRVTRDIELRFSALGGVAVNGRDAPLVEAAFAIGLGARTSRPLTPGR